MFMNTFIKGILSFKGSVLNPFKVFKYSNKSNKKQKKLNTDIDLCKGSRSNL